MVRLLCVMMMNWLWLDEAVEHFDEAIDVRFVERRVHFVQHAERARPHHVDREEQRDGGHGPLAAGEQRDVCSCLPGGLAMMSMPHFERIAFVD